MNPTQLRNSSFLLVGAAAVAILGALAWPRGPERCSDLGQPGDERHDHCRLGEGLAAKSAVAMNDACNAAGSLEPSCRLGWVAKLGPEMALDDPSLAVVCDASAECVTMYLSHPGTDVLAQMQRCTNLAGAMAESCHERVLQNWAESGPSKLDMRRAVESPSVNASAAAYWAGVAARCGQEEGVCPEGDGEAGVRCRAGQAEALDRAGGCTTKG